MRGARTEMAATRRSIQPSLPVTVTVEEVRRENEQMVTLFVSRPDSADATARGLDLDAFQPGQFVMVWIPRLDEKPYTFSHLDAARAGITVQQRGPFSERLCGLCVGDRIGLRGPFGRPFRDFERYADSERVALIGGGCGMATIALLAECLPRATVVQGARSADLLLFTEGMPGQVIFTDDGSAGRKGFPTDWLREHAGELDAVYTCGPEVMMAGVADICRAGALACEVSMERYMKCGIGVCGQCECDGRRVCVEGPVFDLDELANMPAFGRARRDKTGRSIPIAAEDSCSSTSETG